MLFEICREAYGLTANARVLVRSEAATPELADGRAQCIASSKHQSWSRAGGTAAAQPRRSRTDEHHDH
jgi:hypothetical protein